MKVIGIIAEYNPMQNGHEYQLKLAKEQFHADYVIVVMTGSFHLRGLPAVMGKEVRARHAVMAGADLVIGLPACYSLDETPGMAKAAISLFDSLGVVDAMLFGSELGDIRKIREIAAVMESEEYRSVYSQVSASIKKTNARREETLRKLGYTDYSACINNPNNLLGIRFVMTLHELGSQIMPLTHLRRGQAYLDERLETASEGRIYSSASAVRSCLREEYKSGKPLSERLCASVPDYVYQWMREHFRVSFPVFHEDCWDEIASCVEEKTLDELSGIYGIDADYAKAMKEEVARDREYAACCRRLKERFPNINPDRRFYRAYTNQTKCDYQMYMDQGVVFYANVLAASRRSDPLLQRIREVSRIPLIYDLNLQNMQICTAGYRQLENDRETAALYTHIQNRKVRG